MALISATTDITTGQVLSSNQIYDIYTQLEYTASTPVDIIVDSLSAVSLSSTSGVVSINTNMLQIIPMCGLDDYNIIKRPLSDHDRTIANLYSMSYPAWQNASLTAKAALFLITHLSNDPNEYYQKLIFKHRYTDQYNYNIICQPNYFYTSNTYDSDNWFIWAGAWSEHPTFNASSGSISATLTGVDSTEIAYAQHALNIYDQLWYGTYDIKLGTLTANNIFIDSDVDQANKVDFITYTALTGVSSYNYGLDLDLLLKANGYKPNDYPYKSFFITGTYNKLMNNNYWYSAKVISLKFSDTDYKWNNIGDIKTWTTPTGE
jgi:hypothetical protein